MKKENLNKNNGILSQISSGSTMDINLTQGYFSPQPISGSINYTNINNYETEINTLKIRLAALELKYEGLMNMVKPLIERQQNLNDVRDFLKED